MCRAGGRRCEHNWTDAQRNAVNRKRRERYQAQKSVASNAKASDVETSPAPTVPAASPIGAFNETLLGHLALISKANEDMSRAKGLYPAEELHKTIEFGHDMIKKRITEAGDEATALSYEAEALKASIKDGSDNSEIYSKIADLNVQILDKQSTIRRHIKKLDEREIYNYNVNHLDREDRDRLFLQKSEADQDIRETLDGQITVVGSENVDLSKIDYMKHNSVRAAILSAGIKYPMSSWWDEMGSSEKDMWEERSIRGIEILQKRK